METYVERNRETGGRMRSRVDMKRTGACVKDAREIEPSESCELKRPTPDSSERRKKEKRICVGPRAKAAAYVPRPQHALTVRFAQHAAEPSWRRSRIEIVREARTRTKSPIRISDGHKNVVASRCAENGARLPCHVRVVRRKSTGVREISGEAGGGNDGNGTRVGNACA